MTTDRIYEFAPPLIALQFLALGWSVNREINVGDADGHTVIPLPDVINIVSLFATVGCLVVLPIATESDEWLSRMVLAGAYILIAFHPLTVAAHYRFWKRDSHVTSGAQSSYVNREELISSFLSVLLAAATVAYLGMHQKRSFQ